MEKTLEQTLLYQDRYMESPEVCKELADLYAYSKPLSSKAYLMKAARLGGKELRSTSHDVSKHMDSDPSGAYLMGQELCYLGRYQDAYPYLVAAGSSSDTSVVPLASLYLADLLSSRSPSNREAIRYWYDRAAAYGNPDIPPFRNKRDDNPLFY